MKIMYRVTLPEPCSEDWEQMKSKGCGRHCAACEKTVVDFTAFSDDAFIEYFRKNGINSCGRFSPHQFDLEIPWLDTDDTKKRVHNPLQKTLKYAALSLIPLATPAVKLFAQEQQQMQKVTPTLMQSHEANIKRPVTDIIKALEGSAPGPQTVFSNPGIPSSSPSIIIRGNHISEIPLIVLNGNPFRGNITDIDPKEVKTLNILKDSEATTLYGAAGVNGVIIIKTKQSSFWYRLTKPFRKLINNL